MLIMTMSLLFRLEFNTFPSVHSIDYGMKER
jgi:hypothetical protein